MRDDDTGLEIKTTNQLYMDRHTVMTRQWYQDGRKQRMVEFPADDATAKVYRKHLKRKPCTWNLDDDDEEELSAGAKKMRDYRLQQKQLKHNKIFKEDQ